MNDAPTRLSVGAGGESTIRLPGLGTSGYLWEPEVEDESIATVEKAAEQPELPECAGIGASRDEVFLIRAARPGKTRVRFVQRRPWETNVAPLNEHIVEVDVMS